MSRTLAVSLFLLCVIMSVGKRAAAQACCAGSGAYLPGRLQLHEVALTAASFRAAGTMGSLSASGRYVAAPPDAEEVGIQESLTAVVRVLKNGQLGFNVPFVQTYRASQGLRGFGGGLSDISLSSRYDFSYAGQSVHLPGIGLTANVTAPSGTPVDEARNAMLVDATSNGTWQAALGLSFEYAWDLWLVSVNILASASLPRTVGQVRERLGPQFSGLTSVAYLLPKNAAIAVTIATSRRLDATINGVAVEGSGQSAVAVGLSGAMPLTRCFRVQISVLGDLPALGHNSAVTVGAHTTLVYAFH